ncbi:hypothetical protein AB1N83_012461, partial [Pleurotus pulmonarius]
QAQSVFR